MTLELYDVRRDPYELHNLANVEPARVADALHRDVLALERCRASGCRVVEDAPVPG